MIPARGLLDTVCVPHLPAKLKCLAEGVAIATKLLWH